MDYNKIKERFHMFGNTPTHDIILSEKDVQLCLVHNDFQFYITPTALYLSHKWLKDESSFNINTHSVKKTTYNNETDLIKMIEFWIKESEYARWYRCELRGDKLNRIDENR
jgi:hypothetical protein